MSAPRDCPHGMLYRKRLDLCPVCMGVRIEELEVMMKDIGDALVDSFQCPHPEVPDCECWHCDGKALLAKVEEQ